MSPPVRILSSMATRGLLAELAAAFQAQAAGMALQLESVGGVDAAKRVQAGEAFDLVVLASKTIDALIHSGHALAGSRADLVHSGVAVAVQHGAAAPAIDSEQALRQAVLAARSLGYSTGPSGVQLLQLFERWGISEQLATRLVQAPPGVPVAHLVAQGDVALGFQQHSEMLGVPGIHVLGPLPAAVQIVTTFSGAVCSAALQPDAARAVLAFMASPKLAGTKQRHGMAAA